MAGLSPRRHQIKGFFDFPGDQQKSVLEYAYSILNRKWTVLAVFLVGVAIAVFVSYTATPYYVSRATIEITRAFPAHGTSNELFLIFGQSELYFQTQIEALRSRGLAEKFLQRMAAKKSKQPDPEPDKEGVQQVPAVTQTDRNSQDGTADTLSRLDNERRKTASIDSVLGRVTVTPVSGTHMIDVNMGASDPLLARDMLDEYINTFIQMSNEKRDQLGSKLTVWLNDELSQAENRLKQSQTELFEFTKEHDIVVAGKDPNPKTGEFEKAGQEWIKSQTRRLELEGLQFEKERTLPANISDEYLESLKRNLAALRSEYTGLSGIYSPEYFKMALLRNKIKSTEQAIAEIEQNTLSSAVGVARKKESAAKEAYDKAKQEAIGMNSLGVKYGILKKAVEANEKIYLMLLERSKQAELDHGTMGYQTVLINPPSLPLAPVRPNKAKMLFTGAILGLLGGLTLAFCLELVDNTVQSPREIRDRLNLPILGTIPVIEDEKADLDPQFGAMEFAAHRFPASPFADAIRIIQNTVSVLLSHESASSIVVTSALPLEGKTLLSIVMGTVVASEKKKALIVDCDLRNPRIHTVFRSPVGDVGLSDLLVGRANRLREVIRQSHVPSLYYIPAGFMPENPVALLKSDKIRDILEACKKVFDVVILDTPPILGLVDARILAGYADGLILITKAGQTSIAVLREAADAVIQARGRLLGIVLNMADYKKGYGYGSGYYGSPYYNKYYHRYYHRSHHHEAGSSGGSGDRTSSQA